MRHPVAVLLCMWYVGVVRTENVQRVQLISSLLSDLLTSVGQPVIVEVPQFDAIVDLLFQVVTR